MPPATAALACAVLVLATACSGRQDPATATGAGQVAGASSLSATLARYRSDIEPRRIQVRVEQGDGPAVPLRGIELEVPGFAATTRRDLDTASRPGAAVDLPVPLGAVRCPAPGQPPAEGGPVTVRLAVGERGDPLDLVVRDPQDLATRLRETECREQAVRARVELAWGPTWTRRQTPGQGARGLALDGTLRVGPVAPGSRVELVRVDGTVLLQATATGSLPVSVGPGAAVDVPVTMTPARCDAHAVGEAKRGYAFGVRVAVDSEEPVTVPLEPSAPVRSVLEGGLLDACGLR